MYCKTRSYTTTEYKTWQYAFFHKIDTESNLKAFADLREAFNPKKQAFIVNIITYYPHDILYTKKGTLSSKAHDRSNVEKPIVDLIFLPKYFNQESPYGCKNLNIDDKYILDISSKKRASEEAHIEIEIEIINNLY